MDAVIKSFYNNNEVCVLILYLPIQIVLWDLILLQLMDQLQVELIDWRLWTSRSGSFWFACSKMTGEIKTQDFSCDEFFLDYLTKKVGKLYLGASLLCFTAQQRVCNWANRFSCFAGEHILIISIQLFLWVDIRRHVAFWAYAMISFCK